MATTSLKTNKKTIMEETKMGYMKYYRKTWNEQGDEFLKLMQARKIEWRKEPASVRIEHPTRLDRARSLGYKAKQGFIMVRQRLIRGGRQRPFTSGGRKTSNISQVKSLNMNFQQVAEQRANDKYPNCEVLNSYYVANDGNHIWYEVILVDRDSPSIVKDKGLKWVYNTRGKVYRGLTSAARKSRGLRRKGFGAEKSRPSQNANRL